MAYNTEQQINTGLFIPTTSTIDIGRLYELSPDSEEFKDFIVKLRQDINNVALALNNKYTAYFLNEQFATGAQFTNPASTNPLDTIPGFNKFIIIGALGAGVTNTPHGMTIGDTWKMISIQGAASDTVTKNYYPITSAGAAANNIEVRVDATDVIVTNNSGVTFTNAYVILEFIKV